MIKATVYGNLGNDAELRVSKSGGSSFLTFSVAHTNKDITTWVNCVCFEEKTISFNKDKLLKGARVVIYGDMNMTLDTKNNPRLELIVRDVVSAWVKDGAVATKKPAAVKSNAALETEPDDEDTPFLYRKITIQNGLNQERHADNNGVSLFA